MTWRDKVEKTREEPIGYVEYEDRKIKVFEWPEEKCFFNGCSKNGETHFWKLLDPMFCYLPTCDEHYDTLKKSGFWEEASDIEVKPIEELSEEKKGDLCDK